MKVITGANTVITLMASWPTEILWFDNTSSFILSNLCWKGILHITSIWSIQLLLKELISSQLMRRTYNLKLQKKMYQINKHTFNSQEYPRLFLRWPFREMRFALNILDTQCQSIIVIRSQNAVWLTVLNVRVYVYVIVYSW